MMKIWTNKPLIVVLVAFIIYITATVANLGPIIAFIITVSVAVIARKQGSWNDLGFKAPGSWSLLLGTTLIYGLMLQCLLLVVVDPLLGQWTGAPVDISSFDAVRGDIVNFLVLLVLSWVIGGFFEELAFRGFIVGRVRWLLGSTPSACWIAVVLAAIPFGIAHAYQGAAGMISTGLTGFIFGAVYVLHRHNLWYAIFTHGFTNSFGVLAIFLDVDLKLGQLLF